MDCSNRPESREAVLALAKHIMLKAPDKAEHRTIATDAAAFLLQIMPTEDQYAFVVFMACLSRSSKVKTFSKA